MMVPFWVLSRIRHLAFREPKRGPTRFIYTEVLGSRVSPTQILWSCIRVSYDQGLLFCILAFQAVRVQVSMYLRVCHAMSCIYRSTKHVLQPLVCQSLNMLMSGLSSIAIGDGMHLKPPLRRIAALPSRCQAEVIQVPGCMPPRRRGSTWTPKYVNDGLLGHS